MKFCVDHLQRFDRSLAMASAGSIRSSASSWTTATAVLLTGFD